MSLLRRLLPVTWIACVTLWATGCSSLGLSLFPTGHYLTEQTEAVMSCSPPAAELPRELDMDVVPAHFLQPGDVLLIEPIDIESDVRIPADQKVMADGSLDLAKYGRVIVAGLTLESAEDLIERTMVDAGEKPTQMNVRLLEPTYRFYVLGEVNSPGSYPLEGNESVLDGILAAGGLTSAAAPCKILLARPTPPPSCRVTLQICYREITQLGDTTTNYQLRPGDRIFVATRTCCEDLMFWEASSTCSRCCKCQTACVDPNMATFVNPMARVAGGQVSNVMQPLHVDDTHGVSDGPLQSDAIEPVSLDSPTSNGKRDWMANPRPSEIDSLPSEKGSTDPSETSPEAPAPQRLPSADGELDFDHQNASPSDRFEPLWITPAKSGDE